MIIFFLIFKKKLGVLVGQASSLPLDTSGYLPEDYTERSGDSYN